MINTSIVDMVDIVHMVIRYYYNIEPEQQIKELFGNVHADYASKWYKLYRAGFVAWWGAMDDAHARRYIAMAQSKYQNEIINRRKSIETLQTKDA